MISPSLDIRASQFRMATQSCYALRMHTINEKFTR